MSTDSKTAIIALTPNGKELGLKLRNLIEGDLYLPNKLILDDCLGIKEIDERFSDFIGSIFNKYDYIVFIMAAGIVVRSIASYIKDKTVDPGVIVMDEKGKNVISLLSGHVGGANEMTLKISSLINANPVITTATDVNEKGSLDLIIKKLDGSIDNFKENVKTINYLLVENKKVGIYMDDYFDIDIKGFEKIDNFQDINKLEVLVYITNKKNIDLDFEKIIKIVPKNLILSIGCRKDTDSDLLYESFIDFIENNNIDIKSIKEIGSVDVKKDEKAIIDLAKRLDIPFKIVDRSEILKIEDKFPKSEFVKKSIGVYSVSEPVAYILSGGNLISGKTKYKGITFGLGKVII